MKVITKQQHSELMEFLEPHLKSLWELENREREKQEKDQLEMFQFGFSIYDIFPYKIDEDVEFYIIFNSSFLHHINDKIKIALKEYPEKFGTGNASDVLDALYSVSEYQPFGSIDDYVKYLTDHLCCYIVYKEKGYFTDILRIDLLRQLKPNLKDPTKNDFIGGLLHTLKHFSINDKNLSTGNYIYNIFDIYHLVYLIAMAFRLKEGEGYRYKSHQELSNAKMLASFFREPETGIFFLNSYYKKNK